MLPKTMIIFLTFFCGSIMFSYILPLIFLKQDVRLLNPDGNPGGFNAFQANKTLGLICILLDVFKGLIPVSIGLRYIELDSWWVVPLILSPVLGHAFSPFLKGKGGKCISTCFGSLMGLIPECNIVCILAFIVILLSFFILINPCSTRMILSMTIFFLITAYVSSYFYIKVSVFALSILLSYKLSQSPDQGQFTVSFPLHQLFAKTKNSRKQNNMDES